MSDVDPRNIPEATVAALNGATKDAFTAIRESVAYRLRHPSTRFRAASLVRDFERVFSQFHSDFDPSAFTILITRMDALPDLAALGLTADAAAEISRLQATFGRIIGEIVTKGAEGPEDWESFSIQAIIETLEDGPSRERLALRIVRNDGVELVLSTPPESLVRLVRRILASVARMPETHTSQVAIKDLDQIGEAVASLRQSFQVEGSSNRREDV